MNIKIALVVIAFGFSCAGPTLAFDANHLAKVKAYEDCMGCDLSGANLSSSQMRGAILCNTIMPYGSVIYSGC
jgi:uncharacterized protein YjbI with pentapeptide repeats